MVGVVWLGAMIAVSVWVGLIKAIAATVPAIFWSVVWVGVSSLLGRLQDERMVTSEMDINRSLNVFNFSFMVVIVAHRQNVPKALS
jgi:hypothetical protein